MPTYLVLDDIDVPETVLQSWQITTDLLACIAHIPAALIMRVHAHEIEVFVASHSEGNVYHQGEHAKLNTGLYCENVISNHQALLIPNALTHPGWENNPDVALGMISYYGLPINWPNGEVFGTICILDNKEHHYDHLVTDLISQFRDSIQLSLYHIYHSSVATEQRDQAREALRDNEALFHAVFENAAIGIAQVALTGHFLQINLEFCRIIGYSQEEILAQHMTYQQITLPDDVGKETETVTRLLQGNIDQFSIEKRYLHKMGQVVWVNLSVHLLRDDQQQPLYYISAVQDISERKLVEEELKLAGLVYNNSSEAMAITDAHGIMLAINPAFSKMTGYTLEEIKGQSITLLHTNQHDADFYGSQKQTIEANGQWQGEVWTKHKNGSTFPTWLTINTSYLNDGIVHRRVGLFSDISAIKEAEALILKQANFDQLTKLPNRQLFQDRLEQTIKLSHREHQKCALLFIDLDRFKEVNDTHGHNVGDTLLIEASARIAACVRQSDTVARLGGDEFTVILNDIHDNMMIAHIAQHIIDKLSEPFLTAKKEAFISASVGIAIYPEDANDAQQLLKVADQAMYVAKNAGRGCYRFFTKLMQQESDFRIRLSTDLRQALQLKQFSVHYQPIIELSTGRINKAEALLRWKHPELGYISPDIFIPICEHYGTIHEIGNWVFIEAVKQGAKLKQLLGREIEIAVNKSPVQFKANEEMMHNWIQLLENIHFPTKCVVIEITEGVLMDLVGNIEEKLMGFHNAGMHIAIDDFGTGYSSLSYLKKFNVDYLKIDRSFICNLAANSSEVAICEAIIEMAHRLNIKVIAEGIETETQLHLLEDIHCDFGQGYLFAKPMPAADFEQLLIDLG
ncbi:bifunctional diguanylate cyclase/phosphodiesterase [Methylophilus sp. 5]|uniref:putative bifunctional diguanylate cyclase/phosphodiesterase n=1 Tax=Methylophilus sp. 5 TaxID=1112274 RepID=UPI0004B3415E|nr:EAL domain-containing protein [Methylophilus sp. 5]